jgi:hypothetical protein
VIRHFQERMRYGLFVPVRNPGGVLVSCPSGALTQYCLHVFSRGQVRSFSAESLSGHD